jgi:hypothetical protein
MNQLLREVTEEVKYCLIAVDTDGRLELNLHEGDRRIVIICWWRTTSEESGLHRFAQLSFYDEGQVRVVTYDLGGQINQVHRWCLAEEDITSKITGSIDKAIRDMESD